MDSASPGTSKIYKSIRCQDGVQGCYPAARSSWARAKPQPGIKQVVMTTGSRGLQFNVRRTSPMISYVTKLRGDLLDLKEVSYVDFREF